MTDKRRPPRRFEGLRRLLMHGVIDRRGGPDVRGVKHIPDGGRQQCARLCERVRPCV